VKVLALKDAPGVLGKIVARTIDDLNARAEARPQAAVEVGAGACVERRDFLGALTGPGFGLIAEFKPRSPSRGIINTHATPEAMAKVYSRGAAAASVLCDEPFFGGGLETLTRFRGETHLPVLCKDFILSEYQVFEACAAGADAVLLMASLLPRESLERLLSLVHGLGMQALVETHDRLELAMVLETPARIVGVNSRDLNTMEIDTEAARRLLETVPPGIVRVAESGVVTMRQVRLFAEVADAALVGSAIMSAEDPAEAIRELGFGA